MWMTQKCERKQVAKYVFLKAVLKLISAEITNALVLFWFKGYFNRSSFQIPTEEFLVTFKLVVVPTSTKLLEFEMPITTSQALLL